VLDSHSVDIRFVILDIFFESPSTDTVADSMLQEAIRRLDSKNKIVIPRIYEYETGEHFQPIFKCSYGTSQYRSSFMNEQYLKYICVIDDSVKQMPLVAWEKISGRSMNVHKLGPLSYYTIDGRWCLNTMIPEFRYPQADLIENETYYQLGYFSEYLIGKDQIVIFGDFEGIYDTHHSLVDKVPGPLAMLNAYVAIEQGDNVLSVWFLVMLFLSLLFISYRSFYQDRIPSRTYKNKKLGAVINFFGKHMNMIVIFLVTLVSMLYFHFYLHLLILLTYFGVIEFILHQVRSWRERRRRNKVAGNN
jgi:hypothetical protein